MQYHEGSAGNPNAHSVESPVNQNPESTRLLAEAQAQYAALQADRQKLDVKDKAAVAAFNKKAAAYKELTNRLKQPQDSPSASEKLLIGSWQKNVGPAKVTLFFTEDHRWTGAISGRVTATCSGTWNLTGNILATTTLKDSLTPKETVGRTDRDTIVTLNDSVLSLLPADGRKQEPSTMVRVR
jgi:ribosomal protein L11 methylase PrmA